MANEPSQKPDGLPEQNTENDNTATGDSLPVKATFAGSLLLVLALFAFLGGQAFRSAKPDSPTARPKVTASVQTAKAQPLDEAHWFMPVSVQNAGNVPVEEVLVRVTYRAKSGERETVDLTFNYLAEGATEEAFAVTDAPPGDAKIEANIAAFKTERQARGY